MSTNVSKSTSNGIGFFSLLCIAFIVLKLIGVINWSWFWVLSPILLPILIVLFIIAVIVLFIVFKGFIKYLVKKVRK